MKTRNLLVLSALGRADHAGRRCASPPDDRGLLCVYWSVLYGCDRGLVHRCRPGRLPRRWYDDVHPLRRCHWGRLLPSRWFL